MTKINFKNFVVYTSVSRTEMCEMDVRESFADMVYKNVSGIKAHALALKIYESDGAREYTDEEVGLIRAVSEKLCVPGFIDGLNEQIHTKQE